MKCISSLLIAIALHSVGYSQLTNVQLSSFPLTLEKAKQALPAEIARDGLLAQFKGEFQILAGFFEDRSLGKIESPEMHCIGLAMAGNEEALTRLIADVPTAQKGGLVWLAVDFLVMSKHFEDAKYIVRHNAAYGERALELTYVNAECNYNSVAVAAIRDMVNPSELNRWRRKHSESIEHQHLVIQIASSFGLQWRSCIAKVKSSDPQLREAAYQLLIDQLDVDYALELKMDPKTYWLWLLHLAKRKANDAIVLELQRDDLVESQWNQVFAALITADRVTAMRQLDSLDLERRADAIRLLAAYSAAQSDGNVIAIASQFDGEEEAVAFLASFVANFYSVPPLL